MTYIAWLGSLILQLHTLPQVYTCYKQKHANGFSKTFLAMWVLGCFLMLIYSISLGQHPLIVNYALNTITGLIVSYYKWRSK